MQAPNCTPLERAVLAMSEVEPRWWLERQGAKPLPRLGLAEKALAALDEIPESTPQIQVAQLDLMLRLGRFEDVRNNMHAWTPPTPTGVTSWVLTSTSSCQAIRFSPCQLLSCRPTRFSRSSWALPRAIMKRPTGPSWT